jgi:Lipocalin-like domain
LQLELKNYKMKKLFLLLSLLLIVVSCKPKEKVANTTIARKSNVAIKGDWKITSVTYPGSDYIKVTSFDLADSKCMVGSTWKFISNNNSGNMAMASAGCPSYETKITWYVNKEDQFILKFLDESKAKKVKEGYILKVAEQSENSFQLLDGINVGGKMVNVVYQFTKA